MKKLILTLIVCAGLLSVACWLVDMAQSGANFAKEIRRFHNWTVVSHWVNPANRQIVVLLDEKAVEGTDSTCEAVLDMLDHLTTIIPRSWTVKMISPTGWIPAKWNPIDREGVEWMIQDWSDKQREEDERTGEWRGPAPASHRYAFHTESSH